MQNVRDLNDSLKETVHDKLRNGQSNQESIYYKSWQKLQPFFTSAKFRNTFWNMSTITKSMQVNSLKYRFGRLWNKKLGIPHEGTISARRCTCKTYKLFYTLFYFFTALSVGLLPLLVITLCHVRVLLPSGHDVPVIIGL